MTDGRGRGPRFATAHRHEGAYGGVDLIGSLAMRHLALAAKGVPRKIPEACSA
jgi:hypothetical protein